MKLSTAKRRINKTLDELCESVIDDWYANFKNGYIKGYEDARQGKSPMYVEAYKIADTPQTDCEKCEHWKYIAHEWQCETEKCQKTPQTESTGSPIGDYRDGVGAWQTDCGWK